MQNKGGILNNYAKRVQTKKKNIQFHLYKTLETTKSSVVKANGSVVFWGLRGMREMEAECIEMYFLHPRSAIGKI